MKVQVNRAHSIGFWQAGHEEHCPSISQIQRPIVVLLFHPKEVVEVALLPAQALHVHQVEDSGISRAAELLALPLWGGDYYGALDSPFNPAFA